MVFEDLDEPCILYLDSMISFRVRTYFISRFHMISFYKIHDLKTRKTSRKLMDHKAMNYIAGFSPKRRSVAQRPAVLSECHAEKIIKVLKIIHIFSEKKIDKTSKEICFFKLDRDRSIASTPPFCKPPAPASPNLKWLLRNRVRGPIRCDQA